MNRRILFFGGYLGLCLTCLMPVATRLVWLRFHESLGGPDSVTAFMMSASSIMALMGYTSFVMVSESTRCDD